MGIAAALPLCSPVGAAGGATKEVVWRGVALGGQTEIRLVSPDRPDDLQAAEAVLKASVTEIRRLEGLFSLYQPQSLLNRLNRDGVLDNPPGDVVALIGLAQQVSRQTNGAFDATIQPLWQLYAGHFSRAGADPRGPSIEEIDRTRRLVDYRLVQYAPRQVRLTRPGMALSLNGIAQGYITDRIADLLRGRGFENILVNLGELSGHGRPWPVAIAHPGNTQEAALSLNLTDRALATSSSFGYQFSDDGQHNHLLDPRTGRSARLYGSVSVVSPSAALADALSTAYSIMAEDELKSVAAQYANHRVIIVHHDGTVVKI